jgi:UDP-glucose 4-epimerase
MKILVTGGAGFIGSHVAEALLDVGHDVHVIDDLSSGFRRNVPDSAVLHVCDIRGEEAAVLIGEHEFDVLVHHAAQMDVRASVRNPRYDADVNIGGTLNLIEAGRRNGLEKVVFASTGGAIYGEPDYIPQDEEHSQHPLSPYGITKLATEKYLRYYEHVHDLQFVALRYANVYGPRQNAHGDAGVVAIFSNMMLKGEQPTINGSGEQTRDYVFVKDVVRANLKAIEYDASGIFNIGTSKETSVNELFEFIQTATGVDIAPQHGPAKPGEQQRSVLSFDRARDQLSWVPHMDVKNGVHETVRWFESRRGEIESASVE